MEETKRHSSHIAILGAGSWGATLAWLLASNGRTIRLWSHNQEKALELKRSRRLEKPLQVGIPESVLITGDLAECIRDADLIIFCCTAQAMRPVAVAARQILSSSCRGERSSTGGVATLPGTSPVLGSQGPVLVSAAKGIELETFSRMSGVLGEIFPDNHVCALSGPNLAAEVLEGLPAASVIACGNPEVCRYVQEHISVPGFRVYTNDDIIGVELGGSLKNIMAIAAGVVDGLNLGTNAKAALMTRGLAEMTRLSVALGARSSTLSGLSGMGDLVVTCYSSLSRNYRLGYRMAQGESLLTAEKELGAIAEGVTTARAVCELSKKLEIELPIADQVDRTLRELTTPVKAIMSLMTRPLASE